MAALGNNVGLSQLCAKNCPICFQECPESFTCYAVLYFQHYACVECALYYSQRLLNALVYECSIKIINPDCSIREYQSSLQCTSVLYSNCSSRVLISLHVANLQAL